MTTSQNEQLEAAAQYEALKKVPEEYRTADMKAFIEQYGADSNINEDSEVEGTTNSVVVAGINQQAEDTDALKAKEYMGDYFKNAEEILEDYLPKIEDTRIKNSLIMSAAASSVAKWSRHDIDVKVASIDLAKDVANVLGSLSFASSQTPTTISKAIKEMQAENPYITLAVTYTDTPRNTLLDEDTEKKIKPGNKLIVHTDDRSYSHTDLSIASLENIFEKDATPKKEKLDPFSPEVTRSRYLLSEVHASGKAEGLIKQLETKRPKQVDEEKYKGWVGILAMASLTSQELYDEMQKLMIELAGNETLDKEIKLAVALDKVIPKYESLLNDCKVVKDDDKVIPTTLVKTLLEGVGYKEDDVSGAFTKLGFPLKDHRQGLKLAALKEACSGLLKEDDDRVKDYRDTLNK